MSTDPVELLRRLVSIPSVNPMGQQVDGPEYFETRLTDFLQSHFESLSLPWQRQEVAPGRENILVKLEGNDFDSQDAELVLWEVHQDTVPVTGMTIDPFSGEVRDTRVYGRGACDIKGGMSAMLTALERLAQERPAGMPTIVLACTVNEEHGYTGATALKELWQQPSEFFPRPPSSIVVAEPTELDVVIAHKGAVRWCLHTLGKAAHSSSPQLGENAIIAMSRVLTALDHYANEILPRTGGSHPLCGRPTLSVGIITGGISVNTVPDRCTIEIDRRLIPGENPEQAMDDVINYLNVECVNVSHIEYDPPFLIGHPMSDENNNQLAESLIAHTGDTGGGKIVGVPYGTDAAVFAADGIPTVVFGPGSIAQAHTEDEWLEIEQLQGATEVLYRFGRSGVIVEV